MSFLTNLLGKKESKINSYADFWTWFQSKEKDFYRVVKNGEDIERKFFELLAPKLGELREGYFYLTGMLDDNTAELILTADGEIKNFIYVEELVQAAPFIKGWKFTAHKPAGDLQNTSISMAGLEFNGDNLRFQPIESLLYPDEIEIKIFHPDLNENNKNEITRGVYIFLDNYLGEENFATEIDFLDVGLKSEKETIPMSKLKDYLLWRKKEFTEKYESIRHNTEDDQYSSFEAKHENGNAIISVINTDLLKWDRKASHPWILKIEIKYGDPLENKGMPDNDTYALLGEIENEVDNGLKDADGYLNVGRETANGQREIYYACKDFRRSSKVANDILKKYSNKWEASYNIYKDKYWKTFERYTGVY